MICIRNPKNNFCTSLTRCIRCIRSCRCKRSNNSFSNLEYSRCHCYFKKFWNNKIINIFAIEEWINASKWSEFFCSKLNVSRPHKSYKFSRNNSISQRSCCGITCYLKLCSYPYLICSSYIHSLKSSARAASSINYSTASNTSPCCLPIIPLNKSATSLRIISLCL